MTIDEARAALSKEIIERQRLQEENSELKRLLRLAVDGFEHIGKHFTMCSHDDCDKCPYYIGERLVCPENWKHAEEAMKILEDNNG